MDKSMVKGIIVGVAIAVGVSAVAGYQILHKEAYAKVIAVKDVTQKVETPREDCDQVAVQKQAPVQDKNKIAGTVLGAVVGGVLGNQIGGGTGKKLATVGGAVAGGYAGNQIQGNMQKSDVVTSTQTRCKTVSDITDKLIGYDVTYILNGQQGVVRMSFNPGARIPVKDGQLVLTPPTTTTAAAATVPAPAIETAAPPSAAK